jgi:hypothetical protein
MIELVSSAREYKNRIKKLLALSPIDLFILNCLAEILMFWCFGVVLAKIMRSLFGKIDKKL